MASPYRVLAFTVLPLLRWRIQRIDGREHLPSGAFIVAVNHQSWIDSAILGGALYRHIGKSLRFIAQSSKWRSVGGIPINEYNKSSVLDIAYGYLEAGHPVVVFPEGNSNKNPELRSGKTGAARLALRSGLPVVPIGIQGTNGVKAWQAQLWFFRFWKPCRVTIGEPMLFPRTALTGNDEALLMTTTDRIMRGISAVSSKPYADAPLQPNMLPNPSFLSWLIWRVAAPLIYLRIRVHGTEHLPTSGAFIVVGNHNSYFDAPTLSAAVYRARKLFLQYPTKPTVAAALQRIVGQRGLTTIGIVPIDPTSRATVLDAAIAHLRSGGAVGIFPEGMRNKPSVNPQWQTTMLRGKTGVARLWLASGAPVIPVGIEAPYGISYLETLLIILRFWKPVHLTFGPPVAMPVPPSTAPSKEDLEQITRIVMRRVAALCHLTYTY
ncbi:MAG: 1-acyl-sn-glycerol-3-phosphate acyltransferase [Candidatus Kerfeldbacteria bacterium]|nr:1-acyl-sn-glycerol-3-phosphate acyltransferase [Candidatus Kerfeldbacteria bacterium]